MFFCASTDFCKKVTPSRTAVTFFSSGFFLAMGYWIIIAAFLCPDDKGNAVSFDGYVFIPGIIVLLCMFLLNTFTTRNTIFHDETSFFDAENSRGAKFLVYICLCVSVIAIGIAFMIGEMYYNQKDKPILAFAAVANSITTFIRYH